MSQSHPVAPTPEGSLCDELKTLPDSRRQKSVDYPLHEVLFIALCAMLSGAEAFTEFEEFGRMRRQWLGRYLTLGKGIPSHDTFRMVFAQVDPKAFNEFFIRWTGKLCQHDGREIIAVDGKSLKGSSKDRAVHLVNAWAVSNHLVLGQVKTDAKSNEITAIPELLGQLRTKDAIITLDAMGTQKKIAALIDEKGGRYVLCLKRNHEDLYDDVKLYLDDPGHAKAMDYFEQTDGGHGRVEVRRHWITARTGWLAKDWQWAGLCALGKVERVREVSGKPASVETAYYLCSIEADAKLLARSVRSHWGVENKVHWVLDMTFGEDACPVRDINAAANLSLLRKLCLNLLRRDPGKGSLRLKRKKAAWDTDYLEQLLHLAHA